jgi:hypothetical protein
VMVRQQKGAIILHVVQWKIEVMQMCWWLTEGRSDKTALQQVTQSFYIDFRL